MTAAAETAHGQNNVQPASTSIASAGVTATSSMPANANNAKSLSSADQQRIVSDYTKTLRGAARKSDAKPAATVIPVSNPANGNAAPASDKPASDFNAEAATPEQRAAAERDRARQAANNLPFATPGTQSSGRLVSRSEQHGFTHLRLDEKTDLAHLAVRDEIARYPGAIVIANFVYEGAWSGLSPAECRKQDEILRKLALKLAETSEAEIVYLEILAMKDAMTQEQLIGAPDLNKLTGDDVWDLVFGADYVDAFDENRLAAGNEHLHVADDKDFFFFPFANVYDGGKPVDSFAYTVLFQAHKSEGSTDAAAHNNVVRAMYRDLTQVVENSNTRLAEQRRANDKTLAKAEPRLP